VPKDYFDKLGAQDIRLFRGYPQQAEMVAKGEYAAGIATIALYAVPHIQAGLPVKLAQLKEGVYGTPAALMQLANAPHPNAARLLINWLLTKEGQTLWHQTEKSLPMRSDVPDYTPESLRTPPGSPIIRQQSVDELKLAAKELEDGLAKKAFKK
jgi:ABC-type Fe3+ transport system substrate-binding protein